MGLLDKAYEQSKINSLDSSEVKDVGEACNELDNVRQAITDKEAEIKKAKEKRAQDIKDCKNAAEGKIKACGPSVKRYSNNYFCRI